MGFDLNPQTTSTKRNKAAKARDRLIADATANGGFTTIPNAWFKPNCLSSKERLVLIVLLSWCRVDRLDEFNRRSCRVGLAKLSDGTGLHRATVKRALTGLVAKKMIERTKQKTGPSVTVITWAQSAPTPSDLGAICAHLGAICALHGCTVRPPWDHQRSHLEEREEREEDLNNEIDPIQLYSEILTALPAWAADEIRKQTREISMKDGCVTFHATSIQGRDMFVDDFYEHLNGALLAVSKNKGIAQLRWRSA
jgi:hypothetical protein